MPGAVVSVAVLAALLPGLLAGAQAASLAPLLQGGGINSLWRVATLPNQRAPVTQFAPEQVAGRAALRLQAQGSYGNLLHDLPAATVFAEGQRLAWSWRLQKPNASIDLHKKTGDDSPAKVCLSFAVPLERVPFGERQQLRMAQALSGIDLPTATLCWVWGGPEAKQALVDNPYTRRVRAIVLRNAGDALDTWLDESRDIAADFKRAFGDESPALPAATAVLVGADADNTRAHSVAFVADLRITP